MICQLKGLNRPACPAAFRGKILLILCYNGYICDRDIIKCSGLVITVHPCIVERILYIELYFAVVKEHVFSQRNSAAKTDNFNEGLYQRDLEDLITDYDVIELGVNP